MILIPQFTNRWGDIHPANTREYPLTLFLLLNGALYSSVLIASIFSMMSNSDVTAKDFRAETKRLKNFLNARKVAVDVKDVLVKYCNYLYNRQSGLPVQRIFAELPQSIVTEIKTATW